MLKPHLSEDDLRLWRDMLASEADFHACQPIQTNRFPDRGETHAERNYWRGSVLFRTAREIPDHEHVETWLEKSCQYCINALSVPDDGSCNTLVDGKPCKERFIGANVHPEFLFDHHGAVSSDYSIHTTAFYVIAMVSMLTNNRLPLDSLSHHVADMWNMIRRCILPNGRIAFLGGVQRPRCMLNQSYLLPVLLFWQRYGPDPDAGKLAEAVLSIIARDRKESADGSFYSARAAGFKDLSADSRPHYFFRLETDAIFSLGLSYLLSGLEDKDVSFGPTAGTLRCDGSSLRKPVHSRDAGVVFQRTEHGVFSVYWKRAQTAEADPPLALCIPFANPHRVDWLSNLATVFKPFAPNRWVVDWWSTSFRNGFATAGNIQEGLFLKSDDPAGFSINQNLAFVLMPDGRTFLRLEKSTALADVEISEIASLNLNIANDIFTGNAFVLETKEGRREVQGVGGEDKSKNIDGPWANIADEIGVIALYGPEQFTFQTFSCRNRAYKSLLVDRLYYPLVKRHQIFAKGDTILDTGVLLVLNSGKDETRDTAANIEFSRLQAEGPVEVVSFSYAQDSRAVIAVNFSETDKQVEIAAPAGFPGFDPVTRESALDDRGRVKMAPWQVCVFLCR